MRAGKTIGDQLQAEKGQTTFEYGLVVGLVVVVIAATLAASSATWMASFLTTIASSMP